MALAGIFQAAQLTQQLARQGHADKTALSASIHSVLMIDAGSAEEIFGGVRGVNSGLRLVRDKLGGAGKAIDLEWRGQILAAGCAEMHEQAIAVLAGRKDG